MKNPSKRTNKDTEPSVKWEKPFDTLRQKWHEIPTTDSRMSTRQLLEMTDDELIKLWTRIREEATTGDKFNVRGWYHALYKDILKGKKVMDVGSGFGIDGITFAECGALMTFVDIVESNLEVLKRLCMLLGLSEVQFHYMENIHSLSGWMCWRSAMV